MNKLVKQQKNLLEQVSNKHDLPIKLVEEIVKSAERFSYENASPATRKKDYLDLINFYSKKGKGGQ